MRALNLPAIVPDYPATETVFSGDGSTILIAKGDPARWSIAFCNVDGGAAQLSIHPDAIAGQGISLPQVGTFLFLAFPNFPGLVGREWYWVNSMGLGHLTVYETFMKPRGIYDQ
jgi:hypothetical protein